MSCAAILTAARDVGCILKEKFEGLDALAMSLIRLINGYIRATRNLKAASSDGKNIDPCHREDLVGMRLQFSIFVFLLYILRHG